jgi:hypothetical protein
VNSSVMVNKMQLRGSTEHKQVLLDALDHQHWDDDSQRIVFINQLRVSGYWWELAQKIAQETRAIANQSYPSNKHYISDQLAIFANYPDFISHSIQCLLIGKNPWYLQTWLKQENLAADPVVLLQHRIFDLPAIFESLRKSNQLGNLLSFVRPDQLQNLVYSLASICPVLLRQSFENNPPNNSTLINQSAAGWIAEHLSEFSSVVNSEAKRRLLIQLVAGVSAWRFAPQLMNDDQKFKEWFGAVVQIANKKLYPTLTLPLAGEGTGLSQLQNKTIESEIAHKKEVNDPSFQISSDSPSPLPRGRLGGGENLLQFFIQQTGLLFLINFLKVLTPALIPALSQREREQLLSINPWVLLYQAFHTLCNRLNCQTEKPLQELIICISQLTDEEFYQQLADFNNSENQVAEIIEQKLRSMNLWQSDWIYLPARAEVNQAYINIYLDNSSVNLQLRLAGLDVNPGWIPWLGRVIYFHYGQYPELANRR